MPCGAYHPSRSITVQTKYLTFAAVKMYFNYPDFNENIDLQYFIFMRVMYTPDYQGMLPTGAGYY